MHVIIITSFSFCIFKKIKTCKHHKIRNTNMCEKESFEKLTKTFFNILRSTNYSVSYIHTSVCQSLEESLRIETNCVQSNMKVSNPFLSFQLHDNRSPFLLFRKSMTYVIIQSEGDGGGGGRVHGGLG